jgi:hypothetical protein
MAALIYGIKPEMSMPYFFDFEVQTTDLKSVFRAVMGLYVLFSMFWILGIVKFKFWEAATLSNGLFMCGLAFGRLISMMIDGKPSTLFVFGLFGEVILGIFAFYQYKKYRSTV